MQRQPDAARQAHASTALTLVVLGVMVSLLALLGRIAQELQGRVLGDAWEALSGSPRHVAPPLPPPLLAGPNTTGQWLVAVGLAVGALAMVAGGVLWRRLDAQTPYERAWRGLAQWSAAFTVAGTLCALLCPAHDLRVVVLGACLLLALAAYLALVLLLVRRALANA